MIFAAPFDVFVLILLALLIVDCIVLCLCSVGLVLVFGHLSFKMHCFYLFALGLFIEFYLLPAKPDTGHFEIIEYNIVDASSLVGILII